jgi:hypothetical protein
MCGEKRRIYPAWEITNEFSCSISSPQVNFAIQTPIPVPNKTLSASLGFQFNFVLPTNVTEFRQWNLTRFRRNVGEALQSVYLPFEAFLQEYGFDGRTCLLRSICEAAHSPFSHDENGLLEEIAHSILTYVTFTAYTSGYRIIAAKTGCVFYVMSDIQQKGKKKSVLCSNYIHHRFRL